MHILILENGVNIDNLVLSLQENPNVGLIFASQDAICHIDEVTKLDIDSDEVSELLDFALANEIGFTFVLSAKAQSSELIEVFEMNGIQTFGSSQEQYEYLLSRSNTKKMIYKNKIPTTKFAVFERCQAALDWCKCADYPITIMTDMKDEIKHIFHIDTFLKAQNTIEDLFEKGYEKIVIEQTTTGHYFTSYFLTDSVSHVHIANLFKNNNLTVCPDLQITNNLQNSIFNDYYLKILNSLNYNSKPFCGVLKLDFVLIDNDLYLNDVGANFNISDFQMMLQFLDINVFDLLSSVSTGALEDFEGCNLIKDNCYASLVTVEEQPLFEEDDNIECIELRNDKYVYLSQASTINRACEYLNEV